MSTTTLIAALGVPGVLGIVEALKKYGLPTQAAPVAAVGIGVLAGLVEYLTVPALDEQTILLQGLALGLAASGLYSGAEPTKAAISAVLSALGAILPFIPNKQIQTIGQDIENAANVGTVLTTDPLVDRRIFTADHLDAAAAAVATAAPVTTVTTAPEGPIDTPEPTPGIILERR